MHFRTQHCKPADSTKRSDQFTDKPPSDKPKTEKYYQAALCEPYQSGHSAVQKQAIMRTKSTVKHLASCADPTMYAGVIKHAPPDVLRTIQNICEEALTAAAEEVTPAEGVILHRYRKQLHSIADDANDEESLRQKLLAPTAKRLRCAPESMNFIPSIILLKAQNGFGWMDDNVVVPRGSEDGGESGSSGGDGDSYDQESEHDTTSSDAISSDSNRSSNDSASDDSTEPSDGSHDDGSEDARAEQSGQSDDEDSTEPSDQSDDSSEDARAEQSGESDERDDESSTEESDQSDDGSEDARKEQSGQSDEGDDEDSTEQSDESHDSSEEGGMEKSDQSDERREESEDDGDEVKSAEDHDTDDGEDEESDESDEDDDAESDDDQPPAKNVKRRHGEEHHAKGWKRSRYL